MKAALMLVATLTATAPTWGAWTALGQDDAKAVWYVDPETVRVEGSVRQVWALKDMAQPVTDFDLSMQFLYEIDCAGRRHRLVQYQAYKGRMGGGDPTRGGMVFGDWMTAGPGTVGGGITKAVCNRS
ncbi:surface-adhesin E family protein [Azohydromonas australica]|uniref:surface-adhesin E family protein n=1 Tax=Azohydromonas australica TaxID=364039 RepID=UPI0004126138|nr:surface-adhesin E family protein [Azohydromonas australica]